MKVHAFKTLDFLHAYAAILSINDIKYVCIDSYCQRSRGRSK